MALDKKNISKIALRLLGIILGIFALVAGEFDDSPGLQGIGMILIFSVFFSIYKIVGRSK